MSDDITDIDVHMFKVRLDDSNARFIAEISCRFDSKECGMKGRFHVIVAGHFIQNKLGCFTIRVSHQRWHME